MVSDKHLWGIVDKQKNLIVSCCNVDFENL